MEEKKEFKYVQFPLCLMMETYKKDTESALTLILRFGIMNYAIKLKYNLQDVAKQVLYNFYRNPDVLQDSIIRKISKAIDQDLFSDYRGDNPGFDGKGKFDPLIGDNMTELLSLFEADKLLKEDAILNYRLHLATSKDHLNINIVSNDDIIESFNKGLQIKKTFEDKFGADAMPYCKTDMLRSFRDNPKDIELFRAYIGISSMIGRRNFISSNKPAILSRMIGCKSKAAFEYYTTDKYNKDKNLLPTVEKYNKRYHMDKLLLTLGKRKLIMFLSKKDVSVIYLSKYMEPDKLKDLINETKEKQNLQKRIREAGASLI